MNLAFYDHGIDHVPAVVHRDEATHFYLTGAFVDVHYAAVGAEWEGQIRRIVIVDGFEAGFEAFGNVSVGSEGDFLNSLGFTGRALYKKLAILPFQIRLAALEQMSCNLFRLIADFSCGHCCRGSRCRSAAAGISS